MVSGLIAIGSGFAFAALVPLGTRAALWRPFGAQRAASGGSKRLIMLKNIQASYSPPAQKRSGAFDENWWILLVGSALAVGLLASYSSFLFWLTIGVIVGLVATVGVAIWRAMRHSLWSRKSGLVALEVTFSLGTAIWAWTGITTGSPYNFAFGSVIALFIFIATLTAVVLSTAALIMSWSALFDWLANLGFVAGKAGQPLATRAVRFERRGLSQTIKQLALCTLAVLLATVQPMSVHFANQLLLSALSLS